MSKNTKTLLGVALVAGLGYYLYTQYGKKKTTAGFANLMGSASSMVGCPCKVVLRTFKDESGNTWDQCAGKQACQRGVQHQPY